MVNIQHEAAVTANRLVVGTVINCADQQEALRLATYLLTITDDIDKGVTAAYRDLTFKDAPKNKEN